MIEYPVYKNVLAQKTLWEDLAKSYSGDFRIKKTISKDMNTLHLEIPYKSHRVILTESDTKPFKFEIELQLNRKLEFVVGPGNGIEKFLRTFGKHFIKTGNKEFDRKYVIRTNDPQTIIRLLNYRNIFKILPDHDIYTLVMEYNGKSNKHILRTVKDRSSTDKSTMSDLINMEFSMIDFFMDNDLIRHPENPAKPETLPMKDET